MRKGKRLAFRLTEILPFWNGHSTPDGIRRETEVAR